MPSSYLEVFPRHSHIATHRFGVTASCAVRHRALAKVSHAPKIAGPEITPSLHIKSCPSVAMRSDDLTIIKIYVYKHQYSSEMVLLFAMTKLCNLPAV